ncbi:uncharacterized protein [Triticum aestivum]|uniref:uncharacterized protein isoform X2 n=1 Tax=Triticum aestivum TaxID=4565 RepID=UPI001D034FD2|nr:uncharacterized protein LOC123187511 isoform X2 [Triticum aestivum]
MFPFSMLAAVNTEDQQDGQDVGPGGHDRLREGAVGEDTTAAVGVIGVTLLWVWLPGVFQQQNPNEMLARKSSKAIRHAHLKIELSISIMVTYRRLIRSARH